MEPRRNFSLEIPLSARSSSFWIVLWENRLWKTYRIFGIWIWEAGIHWDGMDE